MTKNLYKNITYKKDPSAFGGIILSSDFDGYHSIASMADRYFRDKAFDKDCRTNAAQRDYISKRKHKKDNDDAS